MSHPRSGINIAQLVEQVCPGERLDPQVELMLADLARYFIDDVASFGCALASHRRGGQVELRDIRLHLEKNWQLRVPHATAGASQPPVQEASAGASHAGGLDQHGRCLALVSQQQAAEAQSFQQALDNSKRQRTVGSMTQGAEEDAPADGVAASAGKR